MDDALRALEAGLVVDARWFLSPLMIQAMQDTIGPEIRLLLAKLPPGTRYEEVPRHRDFFSRLPFLPRASA